MWQHDCPEDGKIEVGDNEPCNWCGAVEDLNTCLTALENNLNVVTTAHYRVDAIDGEHSVGSYGSVGFERGDTLTGAQVIAWVKDKME